MRPRNIRVADSGTKKKFEVCERSEHTKIFSVPIARSAPLKLQRDERRKGKKSAKKKRLNNLLNFSTIPKF